MLSSSLDALLKLSKTSSSQKLFNYYCVPLYKFYSIWANCPYRPFKSPL